MITTRYIPENSTLITRDNLPAEVYIYTNKSGQPAAIAYAGKSNKPVWHYRFTNEAQRQARINGLFDGVEYRENAKQERKAARQSFTHTITEGDILYASWGYDQTNIEYFQVVSRTRKTVTFCEIAQTKQPDGFMTGTCLPIKNKFIGKEYTRPVRPDNKVNFAEYEGGMMRRLWKWDGTAKGYSEYA